MTNVGGEGVSAVVTCVTECGCFHNTPHQDVAYVLLIHSRVNNYQGMAVNRREVN